MAIVKRLFDIPFFQLEKYALDLAFVTKNQGVWKNTSTEEFISKFQNISKSLLDLGIKPNDKIAIVTNRNRTAWHIADMAIQQVGAIGVPVYDSTSKQDIEYIFNHADVKFCFVANKELYTKINAVKVKIPTLKTIATLDNSEHLSLEKLIEIGEKLDNQNEVDAIKNSIKPSDLVTIIYTSGTTDKPKGVMLSHESILSNVHACKAVIPIIKEQIKILSFLPVSHVYERMMLYLYQYYGFSISFAESIETIGADLNVIKPHIITVVPRLLEKIHDNIIAKGKELGTIKKKLFNWAIDLGYKFEPYGENGGSYERSLSRARLLIFSKWQKALGGNIKAMYCGSSKLQPNLSRIFNAAGIPVFNGYGLTETSPVISVNSPNDNGLRIGTIGRPIEKVQVKIADDGEILTKGPNNMIGYYKDIDKTESSFINGYFKTGDLGKIDEDGFLYITGRKKENFKTSGGKYINPSKIESELKKSLFIEQLIVIGESEKFPAAIIQPNFDLLKELVDSNESDFKELIKNKFVIEKIQSEINLVNENLGQWEKIKRFELTPEEWNTDSGHLTPTLKVKRDIIKAKYYILFNKIYRNF